MREFINIMDEEEALPLEPEQKARDAALSALYNAKANPKSHGHYNVFWYVDIEATDAGSMVKIVDLLELGLLIISNHKSWRKVARHIVVFPFHEPLSEDHALRLLTDTILKKSVLDGPANVDELEPVKEGSRSIRSMLEQAVRQTDR